jgi:hypothetical protein
MIPERLSLIISIAAGVIYGLAIRLLADSDFVNDYLGEGAASVMSAAFLAGVPFVIGFITVYLHKREKPSVAFAVLSPWITIGLFLIGTSILLLEGAICILMAAPLFLVVASLGGLLGWALNRNTGKINLFVLNSFLILPLVALPIERQIEKEKVILTEHTSIFIKSEPGKVWDNIVKVYPISEEEDRNSLFRVMGFPRPIKAELDRNGIGGVRKAIFDKGLFFTETVTQWDSLKSFTFTIEADPGSIPPTALDEHVTVGGEYFDVLEGRYEIIPAEGGVILNLTSKFRLSTGFNFYSGFWSKLIMKDIQENILNIVKERCEK